MARSRPAGGALAAAILAAVVLVALTGCSAATGVTAGRLQESISATFARLYVLQQADEGNPRPGARTLAARARCTKGTPAAPQAATTRATQAPSSTIG